MGHGDPPELPSNGIKFIEMASPLVEPVRGTASNVQELIDRFGSDDAPSLRPQFPIAVEPVPPSNQQLSPIPTFPAATSLLESSSLELLKGIDVFRPSGVKDANRPCLPIRANVCTIYIIAKNRRFSFF